MALATRQNNKRGKEGGPSGNMNNRRGAWRGGPPNMAHGHGHRPNVPGNGPNGQMGFVGAQQVPPLFNLRTALNSYVVVTLSDGTRHGGHLRSIDPDNSGFTLKKVKNLNVPNIAEQDTVRFPGSQLAGWSRGDPTQNGSSSPIAKAASFRTDTDISQGIKPVRERELQAWTDGDAASNGKLKASAGNRDEDTFGGSSNAGRSWDQFAANHEMFGATTTYDEELYTTKLDRSRPDFQEQEKKAMKIASEIEKSVTNNAHVAEERNIADDSGANEEDKYGAVVRGPGAYVPPGARGYGGSQAEKTVKLPARTAAEASQRPPTLVVDNRASTSASPQSASKPEATPLGDAVDSMRTFMNSEMQRLEKKKKQLVKNEKDTRIADLLKFSQDFKLNRPVPADLVPILAKDEDKQKEIIEKSKREAGSSGARSIGSVISSASARGQISSKVGDGSHSRRAQAMPPIPVAPGPVIAATPAEAKVMVAKVTADLAAGVVPRDTKVPKMLIQAIPPFRGKKAEVSSSSAASSSVQTADGQLSPTSNAFKLNVKANSFRPNPNASSFKPGAPSPSPQSTPSANKAKAEPPLHPFFGKTVIKTTPIHIKDEFNPFKHSKIAEASSITPQWPYNGKPFMTSFPRPAQPPPPPPQHMVPPQPPFEEDHPQNPGRGPYQVYTTYAPYPYPGQHPQQPMMQMQGGPVVGFIPHGYPQGMPFHQGSGPPVYVPPGMNGMAPPQGYMPPPGQYPNTGGPRGSMPPTPMPQHAYYQSPQMSHAVPYPMMMAQPPVPPPGAGPNYDAQSGGPLQAPNTPGMNVSH